MADPAEDGDPDHYSERYTGKQDNGGVHINSGIPNHAYYLLVNGGTNAGEVRGHTHTGPRVTGIGLAAAEQIFYAGFTSLPSDATMAEARRRPKRQQSPSTAQTPGRRPRPADAWEAVGVT